MTPSSQHELAARLRGARATSFWLDDPARPAPLPRLAGDTRTDLAVVGGGYTGLWTALLAKQRDPGQDVLLLEAGRLGWAASGRNGGFVSASLTHGRANGEQHLPAEVDHLDSLGRQNLDEIEETVEKLQWDCDFERTGLLSLAVEPYQVRAMQEHPDFLDARAVRELVDSPTYLGGVWHRRDTALVHPGKLVWSLRQSCLDAGVRIVEGTRVADLRPAPGGVSLRTRHGTVTASRVALGTNAFPALLRRFRWHTVPVYDYALMTEPLTDEQLAAVGWSGRQGLDDTANQFHYYRLSADNRILFGGYDAVYHYGRQVKAEYDTRQETFRRLAGHFDETFPQLREVRFTHAWGGAVDTCTRFFPFFGAGFGGRVAHVAGFTGLGVGMTRFAAKVLLDLLAGERTELTELELVTRTPLPFPPEPVAWVGIEATKRSLAAADRREGRRNLWLRALDRVGLGFDS